MHAHCAVVAVPHLVGISLAPVVSAVSQAFQFYRVCHDVLVLHDMRICSLVEPLLTEKLFAVPFATLQKELADFGKRLCREVKAPSSGIVALRRLAPDVLFDLQRGEQLFFQVIIELSACSSAQDYGKDIGIHAVVLELGARLELEVRCQSRFGPVVYLALDCIQDDVGQS